MAKIIKLIAVLSFFSFIIFFIFYLAFAKNFLYSLTITFGTIFYHFAMRLLVGAIVNKIMKNKADYNKKWFQITNIENKLYGFLKVKGWKNKLPSYQPDLFDKNKHTWDEIAQAMCQAEIVHEIIIVLSFLPIISSWFFGSFYVFLITSILSALFDLLFVIMQRYNRPRVLYILNKTLKK